MKKLFTLLVVFLMAGSAFGQERWTNLVKNSNMEGEQEADWSSFWVHEWRTMDEQTSGFANIVEDPVNPGNHCAKVVIRTKEEADAAGNTTTDPQNGKNDWVEWDSQFFIYATETIAAGKEIRLRLKIRGEKAGTLQTQAHYDPGNYNHYQLFGDINYTTEWADYEVSTTVDTNHTQEANGKFFQSVAFNISTMRDGNTLYFDDIRLEVRDPKASDPNADWINFMRMGIDSHDPISTVNYGSGTDSILVDVSNFMIQIRDNDLNTNRLERAQVVTLEDGKRAVKVPTLDYFTEEVEDLDSLGQQQFDDDGNVIMKTVYKWGDGSLVPGVNGAPDGSSAPQRYSSQFFVSTLHKMKAGERYKFVFWVKADKPASLGTQAHILPTQYQAYDTFGGTSAFPVSTEWTKFELGEPAGQTMPSGAAGCQTVAFDCYELKEANNYYFIFEEFSFSEDNVTIEDRTLGTPENLLLPINTDDNDVATQIDATPMLAAFELEDFSFLTNPKVGDGIKLYTKVDPDDPEDDPILTFGAILGWNDGGFINGEGFFIEDDSDQGINIRFDEESVDGKKVNLVVWNNPDSGISFADGKTVQTKLAVSNAGWYYVYNLTLGTEETLAGIAPVKTAKAGNGLIYNLAGQRVDASYKGLVIKNGQKMIQK